MGVDILRVDVVSVFVDVVVLEWMGVCMGVKWMCPCFE